MKILNGWGLADEAKARQVVEVRRLRAAGVQPRLVIFYDNNSPVILKYVTLKQEYGAEIGVEVDVIKFSAQDARARMQKAAEDAVVHGMIVQLPLTVVADEIMTLIPSEKDVDGLNHGLFNSATAEAIDWLLRGHKIKLRHKRIAIVGRGRLVGGPLLKMWGSSGYDVMGFRKGDDLMALKEFDVIVSATGVPGLIKSEIVKPGAVVVDAGTASEDGALLGDSDEGLRRRDDIVMTPKIGGVGPLTVSLLFEHVLKSTGNLGTKKKA